MYEFLKGRLLVVRLVLLLAAVALLVIGILSIYSLGHPYQPNLDEETKELEGFWKKQVQFAGIGVLGFILVNMVNYRRFGSVSHWIYGGVLLLLSVLLLDKFVDLPFVPVINGTRRWIRFTIRGMQLPAIQPSEFCKIAYILALAWYLRYKSNYSKLTALVGPFALTLLPMVLILLEPDLGTVLLMMPVLFTMIFIAGAKVKHLMIIILLALLTSPLLWHFMKDYQRTRISSVILQSKWVQQKAQQHPAIGKILVGGQFSAKKWSRNEGFHLIRSKYAVASGGMSGYGFRRGPFVKYNFLPARHNDFIFATIAHQWGFWGCLFVLSLYVIIIACGLEIAQNNTDPFGKLLAIGIVAIFVVEVVINVSMTLGLMPITGLTLPLVSYGGSSLLVSMIFIGLLNNVGRSRPFTVAPKSFE
ncbi:MAG: rod shape-determining protein RodA [Planctomycetes bacterium]|nr:rod shape-determining protein RodA [Planctomycetota bacterium]